MPKLSKRLKWIIRSLGILVLLILGCLVLAPKFISMEPVRQKVTVLLSQQLRAEVDLQSLKLAYLPLPNIHIEQLALSFPGKGGGTMGSIRVYPRITALLRGRAELTKVEIEDMDLKFTLPRREEGSAPTIPVQLLLAPLALGESNLELELRDGRLEVHQEGTSPLSFTRVSLDAVLPPKGFTFKASCASNLWQRFTLSGHLDVPTLRGEGRMEVRRFHPQGVLEFLSPKSHLRMEDSAMDVALSLRMEGLRGLQAEFQGSLPSVTLIRAGRKAGLKSGKFTGSAVIGGEGIKLALQELSLATPRLRASGELRLGVAGGPMGCRLEARDVHVSQVRETVLALAGDDPDVKQVFNHLRGGNVPTVTFQTKGASSAELLDLDRMVIDGKIEEGRVYVPEAGLDLEGVKGDAVISKGILEGRNLEAAFGNSHGSQGRLRLGLSGKERVFHLDIAVDADVSQVPPVLKRFVRNKDVLEEMEAIHDLKGRAKGKLLLGESTADLKVTVEATEFTLSSSYKRLPFPIKVQGGYYSQQGTTCTVRDARYQLGNSSMSGFSASIDWTEALPLKAEFKDANIRLEEMIPWLASHRDLQDHLKPYESLKGTLALKQGRAEGLIHAPETWRFRVSGDVQEVAGEMEGLPAPVRLKGGTFEADQEKVAFRDVQTEILDASPGVSGDLHFLEGIQKADLSFRGRVGTKTLEEITRLSPGGRAVHVRSPLTLEPLSVLWERDRSLSFKGVAVLQDGPSITVDVRRESETWLLNRILLQDEHSSADLSLRLQNGEATLSFLGKLNERTLDKIFPGYESQQGWVAGDFQAHLVKDKLIESWAKGRMEAGDFSILPFVPEPVEIPRIALKADRRKFEIETVVFTWAENQFAANGALELKAEGLLMDMDVHSSVLGWSQIKSYLARERKEGGGEKGLPAMPLLGSVRFHFDRFTHSGLNWSPLHAEALFNPDKLEARVTEAKLCGISTLGTAEVTPEGIGFHFEAGASHQEVAPSLECLTKGKRKATGVFDLKVEIQGKGREEELLSSLQGNVDFSAEKGSIYEHILFERLVQYLSLKGILTSKEDFAKRGIPYDRVVVKSRIQDGQWTFQEAVFDGVDLDAGFEGKVDLVKRTIDGRLLVAPFRTMDRIVRFIPIVRGIMGGTLVSIPIKVSGSLDDPKFAPLAASAIGQSLTDMMKRTFNLPVQIFNPQVHRQEEGDNAHSEGGGETPP